MAKVLILSYSNISRDPRVLKQISFFQNEGHEVIISGMEYEGDLLFFPIQKQKNIFFRLLKLAIMVLRINELRAWDFVRNSSFVELKDQGPFDLIFANDEETWPIADKLKNQNPETILIIDAHEFYPGHFNDQLTWRIFHKLYSDYLSENFPKKADFFITVCDGIAHAYEKKYVKKALVVLNTPEFQSELKPTPIREKIQLVHHGIAVRSRKIENMIRMMDTLDDRFHLNLILMPSDLAYYEQLQTLAKGKSIDFIPPVPTKEISSFINQFDIGLFFLEPVNFNYEFALPNKFFEFIQARLAVAIGPSPEMKRIVEMEGNGLVSKTFDFIDLALKLNKLSNEDIMSFKLKSHGAASRYSSLQNEQVFSSILDQVGLKVYPKKHQAI